MIILGIDPGLAIVGWGVIEYKNTKFKRENTKERKKREREKKDDDDSKTTIS